MTMADTIAVMHDGRIEQAGVAADLYERPRTEFVANFLGVSNLIDGKLGALRGRPRHVETHDGARLQVPADRVGPHDTDSIRVGVRPEKITLRAPANGAAADGDLNSLRGTVVVAAFLGTSIQYVVRAPGGEELTVFAQNLDGSEPDSFGPGREVRPDLEPSPHLRRRQGAERHESTRGSSAPSRSSSSPSACRGAASSAAPAAPASR